MVRGERIPLGAVERENADHARHSFKRQRQRRAQCAEFRGIIQVARFHGRVSDHNGLLVLRHPTRQSIAHRNSERSKQTIVVAVYILPDQLISASPALSDPAAGAGTRTILIPAERATLPSSDDFASAKFSRDL